MMDNMLILFVSADDTIMKTPERRARADAQHQRTIADIRAQKELIQTARDNEACVRVLGTTIDVYDWVI